MTISEQTTALIETLEQSAKARLRFRKEVAELLELARVHHMLRQFEELSFHAKFAYRAIGIMKRIGKDAEGYNKLSKEFDESTETVKRLATDLLAKAPQDVSAHFATQFFAMTPSAFQQMVLLFHDLSWYKNYLIDTRGA
jgi:hypothetical protein